MKINNINMYSLYWGEKTNYKMYENCYKFNFMRNSLFKKKNWSDKNMFIDTNYKFQKINNYTQKIIYYFYGSYYKYLIFSIIDCNLSW